ncbi:hypothetical protein [Endozoicomonas acroporae]
MGSLYCFGERQQHGQGAILKRPAVHYNRIFSHYKKAGGAFSHPRLLF